MWSTSGLVLLMFYDKILYAALTALMNVTQSIHLILHLFNYLSNLNKQ